MESLKEAEARLSKKAPHPYLRAGFFKKLIFVWIFPLFYKGYKHGLTEDDIYPHLSEHDSQLLGDRLEQEWNNELKRHKHNPSLWRAFARIFGVEMMFYGVGVLSFEMIRLTHPLALAKLLQYFEPNSTMTVREAYMYAAFISIITLVQMTLIHHSMFHIVHMGMRLRVAAVALVYRKATKLSKSALAETTIGQMVNLISNDVSRFETCTVNVHNIWIGVIQLVVLLFLLHSYVGWTGLTGIGVLLCILPVQIWMGKKTSVYRLRTALRTDERIRLMNEIISGIQVIKMYTWEKPFTKIVEIVRRLEMREIRKNSFIKAIHISFNVFLTRILIYSCILVYILTGNTVNAQYVFGLSLFYEMARQCMSQAFAQGVTQVAEAIISTRRIKEFLLYEEVEADFTLTPLTHEKDGSKLISGAIKNNSRPVGVNLSNVSTRWIKANSDYSLENVNFDLSAGEMATVIGKIGSGKSTLLHVILKELPPLTGTVSINGTISYASQEPWLFVGSVRQNILFGQELDLVKYHEVVRVCALERDFVLFPHGDRTIIGERGVSLSGGQRARINLARAVYKEADIYLLDDPLSAVDAHVGKQIFNQCIQGYLKEKCVVLVTHQLQYLKDCKNIYLLNDGRVQHSGNYEEIKNSGKEFTRLLESLRKMEEEEAKKETEEQKKRKRTLSAKRANEENVDLEEPTFAKESKIEGKVTWNMYKTYFLAGGNACKIIFLAFVYVFSQAVASGVDYFLSIWVNLEQMKLERNIKGEVNDTVIDSLADEHYSEFEKLFFGSLTERSCLLVYTGLVLVMTPLVIGRVIYFFFYSISASIHLHNNMFSKIVYAPMRFFNLNPSGRILNRFSKDMNQVDEYLPITISDTLQIGLIAFAIIIVIATVIPLVLVPTGIILVIFYCLRVLFIATSRDIKRFEAITRSPIYSHLTATLQGLTTIRAFGAQNIVKREFDNYQNSFSSSYYMFMAANRIFGFWLDLHTTAFVSLVTFSFLILKIDAFGGSVGLAITQAISLSGWFQWGIRQWTEMENTMTSVERIKEYADITPEMDSQAKEPPQAWPESGKIKFDNVGLRYAMDEPCVLKNLNFEIKSTEKIGIVGRTGAGKSSIISALFRLAQVDGKILIDNVDSQTIALNKLRSSISIIPQEPVLFSGTLRKNLDPFDEYNDQTIWNGLEEVELKSAVSDLPQGLESKMSEGGSNFSVGQRQLVCLARAIVRKNKILVLDEATASVDPHTDGLIQTTIRKKFAGCTVLTIAHRLHTIMDSDKVLVMDAGRAVEFDHPHVLLQNKGVFYSLVQQTGKGMAANLSDIASKVIKMYTWEKPFAKLVEISRRKEMQQIKRTATIRAAVYSFHLFVNKMAIYICVLAFVFTGNILNAQFVYVITSFYAILRMVLTKRFPEGVTQIAEAQISVRRLKQFLLREEIGFDTSSGFLNVVALPGGKNVKPIVKNSIQLKEVCVKWLQKSDDYSLQDVTMNVSTKELAVIVGPVGSGKTTLLHTILKELPPIKGSVQVYGTISYASQEPWLFMGSIRQNIVFGQPFDLKRYEEVVKVCALERDFTLFPYGDKTAVGDRGVSLSGGQRARINLARAIYKEADIYLLDDPLSAVDTHVGKHIFEQCIQEYLKDKCVVLVTHQLQYLRNAQNIYLMQNGRVNFSGTYEEIQNSGHDYAKLLVGLNNKPEEEAGDNDKTEDIAEPQSKAEKKVEAKENKLGPKANKEGKAVGNVAYGVYQSYFRNGGHWCKALWIFILFFGAQGLASLSDYYVSWWVNIEAIRKVQNDKGENNTTAASVSTLQDLWLNYMTRDVTVIVYSCLIITLIMLALSRSLAFFRFALKASTTLHNNMFDKIVYAAMRFFNTNPSGRILNRFSSDMNQVDEALPSTMIDCIQNGLTVLFTTMVVAIVNPWMLLPTVVILTIFYLMRIIYISTSRDVKRVENITRSPIYSHLAASLQGLTTIRAFGAQQVLRKEFEKHQNRNSSPLITFIAVGRSFGFWLDTGCILYVFLVTMSFLFFKTNTPSGFVGLSITQSITLTGMFQMCIRQWSELENQMTCVERIKEYVDVVPESDSGTTSPPKDWPAEGKVTFKNLSLRYALDEPQVLKDLTFTIKSKEKVGIVGRTGAGKSSIIMALFRLAENEGLIAIDNVDTKTVRLERLRSSVSIIPQEPVLFSGTLRKNLDPFDEYNDEVLWNALEQVELKEAVTDLPNALESRMSEGGSNFSVGQRQLICLARAIIRNNKILVLDEATANVDPQTDALIQFTIRKKFSNCTVLTIAHRLHTIMDSDKVLVMDAGRIAEFGAPFELLQNKEGVFSGMVEQTGRAMADNLLSIAEQTHRAQYMAQR